MIALGLVVVLLTPALIRAEDDLILKARAMIDAVNREDYPAAARDFDGTMTKLFGPEKIALLWKQLSNQVGAFKRRTADRTDAQGEYRFVFVTCEFEKATLDARVVFDKAGKIAGLQFVPSLPPAKYEPPAYADPAKFEETEVTVGSAPWALPGTLTRPIGTGPFPGLVLVHGSGPNDRDETLGPQKPFKDLAWGLASRGIAVLRYEKRTRIHGAQMAADPKFLFLTVKEETIDDAVEAVRLLQRTDKIEPKRVFILGHSLGGMLVPRIAKAATEASGFISLAGLALPFPDTYLRQVKYLLALDGELSDEDKKQIEAVRADVDKIRTAKESDRGSGVKWLGATPAYWLDLRGYDPAEAARVIDRPMLFLQGQRDYQVVAENLDHWKKALEGRPGVEFKLFPKLNHLFMEGQGIPQPGEYTAKHGSVAEEVVAEIAVFILKKR